jgi:prepilin-type N-terminal cleavage/methylation domain-containing protein
MKLRKIAQELRGFTLIELLVTIGIAGILMGIAVPRFYALLPGIRVASAARQVATDLQLARMRAIAQRTTKTITFTPPNLYAFDADTRNLSLLFPGTTVTVNPGNPTFTTVGGNNAAAITTITLTNNGIVRTVTVNAGGKIFTQ